VIARHLAVVLLVPSLACASFEPELVDAVDPSLAAGTVQHTRFELDAPAPPPAGATPPTPSGTGTPGPGETAANPPTKMPADHPVPEGSTVPPPPAGATADVGDGPPAGVAPADDRVQQAYADTSDDDKSQRARNGAFWTGVVLAAVGGGALLATGVTGRVTQKQLADGYDDGSLTHDRERTLRDRGDAMNIAAATSGAIALAGVAIFSIVLGVDYMRCGKLTTKRRKDCVSRGRR